MYVSVLREDETEMEFNIHMCCECCAKSKYGLKWSREKFVKFLNKFKEEIISVPNQVNDEKSFIKYISTIE